MQQIEVTVLINKEDHIINISRYGHCMHVYATGVVYGFTLHGHDHLLSSSEVSKEMGSFTVDSEPTAF